jgi:eukaryotic-like serine/threonine-protein kinase
MSLTAGTRLGSYEIVALLGAGGMGEVYRARDTNLGRDVALKTLPDRVTHDAERLARFRREAQVLAALNHPHIGSIYGIEEANGQRFLVLELVEGETLAARIERGRLPVEEALAIAREIAEALQSAHDQGIIHRDLKPANIALTAHDRVKVLDFGLAKATDTAPASGALEQLNSPTVTSPAMLTGMGVILGTAAYMSPEQARGRAADKRSDVWAFGCVLYEMLTGRRPFEGDEVSDTLAAVLRGDPAWDALPASLPPSIRSLLEGCLEKNHHERISDISTALFILKRPSSSSTHVRTPSMSARSRVTWAVLALAGAAAGAAAAIVLWPRQAPPAAAIARFEIAVPAGTQLTVSRRVLAVSPDGTRIVYAADGRLYLRSLSDLQSRPIPGGDPGILPAFSPDGQSVVFWADPALRRISVTGGVPVTVCETTPAPFGIQWSDHGIVFVQPGTGIMRVSPNGGTPAMLVRLAPADGLAHGVRLLPDGETLLFTLARGGTPSTNFWDKAEVVIQSLKTGQRKTLIQGGSDGRYLPTGHLVYMVEGTMMAVLFDLRRMEVTSGPVPLVEGIRRSGPAVGSATQFDVSSTGVLVYVPGPARAAQDDVFLYDRKGEVTALKLPPGLYGYPRVSPEGGQIALETSDGKQAVVSVYDLSGASSLRRLTFGGNNRLPIWSADGRRLAFQSDREGDQAIFWQPLDGSTAERLTRPEPGTTHVPESWAPRSDVFLFSATKDSETTLWTFSVRDRKASRFGDVASAVFPTNAVFSPDGRWVAYQTGDVGTGEATTYVQPFPPTGAKYEIARGGRPMWSRDGKELFFVPAPSQFMVVSVHTDPVFGFTQPASVPRRFGLAPPMSPRPYDILPDGRIVSVDTANPAGDQRTAPIHVVLNWYEELKAKLPVAK